MLFSIVIPLYNKENQIAHAIESVLAQTYADFALVIVDDGSTDDGYSIAAAFSDPRIQIVRQQNGGVSVARNTGIGLAKGDYVCFLDADDLWLPEHLLSLKTLIEAYPNVGLYATRNMRVECDGTEKMVPLESSMLVADLFQLELSTGYSYLHTNSVCIPRHVFQDVGTFVPGERLGEDASLWLRIAAYYDVALSDAITTVYRRAYSDAFTDLVLPADWSFLQLAEKTLLSDVNIPAGKRESIDRYINRYRQSLCRHALLMGEREKAKAFYGKVNWKMTASKEKYKTLACFFVPTCLLRKAYHKKHHGSFAQGKSRQT